MILHKYISMGEFIVHHVSSLVLTTSDNHNTTEITKFEKVFSCGRLSQFIPLHVIWCQVSTVCHNVIMSGCDCTLLHMLTNKEEVIPLKGKKQNGSRFLIPFH